MLFLQVLREGGSVYYNMHNAAVDQLIYKLLKNLNMNKIFVNSSMFVYLPALYRSR